MGFVVRTLRPFAFVLLAARLSEAASPLDDNLPALLDEFDSRMARSEFAAAAGLAETGEPGDTLRAAARVAAVLRDRPAAMLAGARTFAGAEIRLRMKSGTIAGRLKGATEKSLAMAVTFTINREKMERVTNVAWTALAPEQEDEFAARGGLTAEPADLAMAMAYAALARSDADTSSASLERSRGHPLFARMERRVADARAQAAYEAAIAEAISYVGMRRMEDAASAAGRALEAKPGDDVATALLEDIRRKGSEQAQARPGNALENAGGDSVLGGSDYWVAPMKEVHARFKGKRDSIASLGDSITVSQAYISCFRWSRHQSLERFRDRIEAIKPHLGRQLATSGWTTGDLISGMSSMLGDPPEVMFLLIGTNDVAKTPMATYEANLLKIVDAFLEKGSIVVMSTIPPRKGGGLSLDENAKRVAEINAIIYKVAELRKLPVRRFHEAIVARQPEAWATTLLSDGIHPSAGKTDDISDENIKACGYALMNKFVLEAYDDVARKVMNR